MSIQTNLLDPLSVYDHFKRKNYLCSGLPFKHTLKVKEKKRHQADITLSIRARGT